MRFGSRSHDVEPDKKAPKGKVERDQLSMLLRDLADRIDRANLDLLNEGRARIAAAAESLAMTIERALGGRP